MGGNGRYGTGILLLHHNQSYMLIRFVFFFVALAVTFALPAQNEEAIALGLELALADDFKAAAEVYEAAAKACKQAQDKEGRKRFTDLRKKCEDIAKCRRSLTATESALEGERYRRALEYVKSARRSIKASAKVPADGYEAIDGAYTETAEALFTEVNTVRVQFYNDRLAEADRLLEGKQYAEAAEELKLASSAMTKIVEVKLFKMKERISSARAHAIMMEGALLTDRGKFKEAKAKFAEAKKVADGQPLEGMAKYARLADAGQCAYLPTTVFEMYRQLAGEDADQKLRDKVAAMGCPESMLAPADTVRQLREIVDQGVALYAQPQTRAQGFGRLKEGYRMAPNYFSLLYIEDRLGKEVAERVKKSVE